MHAGGSRGERWRDTVHLSSTLSVPSIAAASSSPVVGHFRSLRQASASARRAAKSIGPTSSTAMISTSHGCCFSPACCLKKPAILVGTRFYSCFSAAQTSQSLMQAIHTSSHCGTHSSSAQSQVLRSTCGLCKRRCSALDANSGDPLCVAVSSSKTCDLPSASIPAISLPLYGSKHRADWCTESMNVSRVGTSRGGAMRAAARPAC